MTITGDGNVGIGTTAPDQPLQVKGVIETQASNSTNGWMMYTYTDDTLRFNFNGAGNDEVTVLSDGRVGIGATTSNTSIRAGHKMTIKETATENASIVFTDTDDMVGVIVGYAKGNNEIVTGTTNVDAVLGTAYASDVHLFTNNSIGLTLLNGGGSPGSVGIGTTGPATKLHVVGGSDANIRVKSASYRSGIFIDRPNTNTTMGSALVLDSDQSYRLGTQSNYHMAMYQDGTTQIWGGQNVGICVDALSLIHISEPTRPY